MKIERFIKGFIQDSRFFLKEAKETQEQLLKIRYIKASIICSWAALEGWLNCISLHLGTYLSRQQIELHEKAFLLEKKLELRDGRWRVSNQDDFQRVEDKILFLLARFGPHKLNKNSTLWSNFQKVKKIRNGLLHPKVGKFEVAELTINNATLSIAIVIEILNMLNKKIYKKALRF